VTIVIWKAPATEGHKSCAIFESQVQTEHYIDNNTVAAMILWCQYPLIIVVTSSILCRPTSTRASASAYDVSFQETQQETQILDIVDVVESNISSVILPVLSTDDSSTLALHCGCSSVSHTDYRGTLNTTDSGDTCQRWDAQDEYSLEKYPELEENYCRNPDEDPYGAWCFTSNKNNNNWAYCNVPECIECSNWPDEYFHFNNNNSTTYNSSYNYYNYSYYDDLLDWATTTATGRASATTTKDSDVVKIQEQNKENNQVIRIGRIVSMMHTAGDVYWKHLDEIDQLIMARAVIDFNNRSSLTTPSVAALTEGCNFYLSLKIRELNEYGERNSQTYLSPVDAWQEEVNPNNATVRPMGFVGTSDYWHTGNLATLSGGQEHPLPFVSPYSFEDLHNDHESKYRVHRYCTCQLEPHY
jgi:hypothetical protein